MNQNDLMLFGYWAKVIRTGNEILGVQDVDTGEKFEVKGKPLIDAAYSADEFETTEKVTRTQIAERLVKSFSGGGDWD
jgi:hypothetical protein